MPTPLQLRRSISDLTLLAWRDVDALWGQVNSATEARDALLDVLPGLTLTYYSAAGALAADWYDDLRDEKAAKGRFRAIVPAAGNLGAEELARWGVGPLFQKVPDFATAKSLVAGGLQRRIANGSRAVVTESSIADPQARGWYRVGSGECDFCQMLIGRGAVYSEATADFETHDRCRCTAVPDFT